MRRLLLVLLVAAMWPVAVSGSDPPSQTPSTFSVRLTTGQDVAAGVRARLIREAAAIWLRAGVRIVWLEGSAPDLPPPALRVIVARRGVPESAFRAPFALAELLNFGARSGIAVAGIDRAEALVISSRPPGPVPAALDDDRIGLALGRAVAHEIGHYLLNTRTHSADGLMRAFFETPELVDPRSPRFDLDEAALAWLRERLLRNEPLGPDSSEFVAVVARR